VYELGCTHNPKEWTLFVDSSKFSLKAVLLRNGNIHLSVSIAHCQHEGNLREYGFALESYSLLKMWMEICGDLRVIMLLGIQSGYTKFCCFVCAWKSRAKDKHYKINDWLMRENSVSGENCVRNLPLGEKDKILLLPLHFTLELMKNFTKTMNKRGKVLEYSREKFPKLSDGKLR